MRKRGQTNWTEFVKSEVEERIFRRWKVKQPPKVDETFSERYDWDENEMHCDEGNNEDWASSNFEYESPDFAGKLNGSFYIRRKLN
ncbi:MAG: hypothetical protein ACTS6P_00910 [Candidatus Hodgkinia cicadicola]